MMCWYASGVHSFKKIADVMPGKRGFLQQKLLKYVQKCLLLCTLHWFELCKRRHLVWWIGPNFFKTVW